MRGIAYKNSALPMLDGLQCKVSLEWVHLRLLSLKGGVCIPAVAIQPDFSFTYLTNLINRSNYYLSRKHDLCYGDRLLSVR